MLLLTTCAYLQEVSDILEYKIKEHEINKKASTQEEAASGGSGADQVHHVST